MASLGGFISWLESASLDAPGVLLRPRDGLGFAADSSTLFSSFRVKLPNGSITVVVWSLSKPVSCSLTMNGVFL